MFGGIMKAILVYAPQALLAGLSDYDKETIRSLVGLPITFNGFDADGRAEIEFQDAEGWDHTLWVEADAVRLVEAFE
jgi:hypothetical protein